ncbi:MAG: WecB/TagA/CpsF family glycosyltransferase [Clostridia bacterium]|nr:WecB/TagA/CpsF family glycosyltransferase [Clostridia bacterium]
MRKTVDIIGIPIDSVTMNEAVEKVRGFLSEDRVHTIYTPNAEIMMDAYRNSDFKGILTSADLLVPDGAGVVLASKILGVKLPEKVAGIDLTRNTFSINENRKIKYYFFGGQPGVAETAAQNLIKVYPHIEIVGCSDGYFDKDKEKEIIQRINSSGADMLLVALGGQKQEKWIHTHKKELKVKVCIGVGGSLDVFAGKATLAPEFFRKNGLEWLYRLYKEPWRFKRMLKLPEFILLIIAVKLKLKKI